MSDPTAPSPPSGQERSTRRPLPALESELSPERAARWAQWRKDNAAAIEAYNNRVREHGCFSDSIRKF